MAKLSNNYHQKKEIVYENPHQFSASLAAAGYTFVLRCKHSIRKLVLQHKISDSSTA
ncbi:hypothetical protein N8009_03755 [Flavobacteriaceae bacterium]|nr:hypothetical protein [Flavobacteriaceae bacterium]